MRSGSPEAGVVASRIVNLWTVRNIDKQDEPLTSGPPQTSTPGVGIDSYSILINGANSVFVPKIGFASNLLGKRTSLTASMLEGECDPWSKRVVNGHSHRTRRS